jgi:hypothetical protein
MDIFTIIWATIGLSIKTSLIELYTQRSKKYELIEVQFYFDPEDNFGILLRIYGADHLKVRKCTKYFTVVDSGISITALGWNFQAKRGELTAELDVLNYSVLPKEE